MLSWERQRDLYNHLAYLKEKERADNFSWDDWRKRVRLQFFFVFQQNPNSIFFIVLEIHEPQEIEINGSIQENG